MAGLANGYLWLVRASLPFFGYRLGPRLFGLRAVVGLVLFLVFFYFGYLKKGDTAS